MTEKVRLKLTTLPDDPGCYQMKNRRGTIIYVGKAKNLKNRVSSYFTGAHDVKTTRLVMEIDDFDYIVTHSEKEALIVEINLIKSLRPRYNILLMDDKTYPYIKVDFNKGATVRVVRERTFDSKAKYYGPYPDATAAHETVSFLHDLLPLQKCYPLKKKLCLYYHMGTCLGYCEKKPDPDKVKDLSMKVNRILRGQTKDLIDELNQEMVQAANNLHFERANSLKKQMEGLAYISQKQNVQVDHTTDMDVFNYAVVHGYLCVVGLFFRNGMMLNKNMVSQALDTTASDEVFSVIIQYYEKNKPAKEILVPKDLDRDLLASYLDRKVSTPVRGQKKQILTMAYDNALHSLTSRFDQLKQKDDLKKEALINLGDLLNMEGINRLDLIDISHMSGQFTSASVIVFEEGDRVSALTRHYNLSSENNDVAGMQEALHRRYRRLIQEGGPFPDLLVVDGGRPQVHAALSVFRSLEFDQPVIGLVKDDRHETRGIYLADDREIDLDRTSSLYLFLANLQDEVHATVLKHQQGRHRKKMVKSKLDNLVGLGPVRKRKLLKHFGSLAKVRQASLEEFQELLGEKVGKQIYEQVQANDM